MIHKTLTYKISPLDWKHLLASLEVAVRSGAGEGQSAGRCIFFQLSASLTTSKHLAVLCVDVWIHVIISLHYLIRLIPNTAVCLHQTILLYVGVWLRLPSLIASCQSESRKTSYTHTSGDMLCLGREPIRSTSSWLCPVQAWLDWERTWHI